MQTWVVEVTFFGRSKQRYDYFVSPHLRHIKIGDKVVVPFAGSDREATVRRVKLFTHTALAWVKEIKEEICI